MQLFFVTRSEGHELVVFCFHFRRLVRNHARKELFYESLRRHGAVNHASMRVYFGEEVGWSERGGEVEKEWWVVGYADSSDVDENVAVFWMCASNVNKIY